METFASYVYSCKCENIKLLQWQLCLPCSVICVLLIFHAAAAVIYDVICKETAFLLGNICAAFSIILLKYKANCCKDSLTLLGDIVAGINWNFFSFVIHCKGIKAQCDSKCNIIFNKGVVFNYSQFKRLKVEIELKCLKCIQYVRE